MSIHRTYHVEVGSPKYQAAIASLRDDRPFFLNLDAYRIIDAKRQGASTVVLVLEREMF